ncbi:hypothetical protein V5O48_002627, partial [Marasmius crinis-equi]
MKKSGLCGLELRGVSRRYCFWLFAMQYSFLLASYSMLTRSGSFLLPIARLGREPES